MDICLIFYNSILRTKINLQYYIDKVFEMNLILHLTNISTIISIRHYTILFRKWVGRVDTENKPHEQCFLSKSSTVKRTVSTKMQGIKL